MRVLMIEDEPQTIDRFNAAFKKAEDAILLQAADVGLEEPFNQEGGESIEEQLLTRLKSVVEKDAVGLVLLDTDLSRGPALQTQTVYRQVFRQVGTPVCRYRKKSRQSAASNLELSYRLATDGGTALIVPHEVVTEEGPETLLVNWLRNVDAGFALLRKVLVERPALLQNGFGPAGILSEILGRPELHADFLGYTAQNSFFFGGTEGMGTDDTDLFATRLGYWLVNYILAFPGPILHEASAAAYLNVTIETFQQAQIIDAIKSARYEGPFASLDGGHYWFEQLAELVEKWGGDISLAPELKGVQLQRVDDSGQGRAFYCLVSKKPIPAGEVASSPDWIPSGAQMTRVSRDDLEQLGPMLNI